MISQENLSQLREMIRELLREEIRDELKRYAVAQKSPDKTVAERMRRYRENLKKRNVTSRGSRNALEGKAVTLRNGKVNGHAVIGEGELVITIPGLRGTVEVRSSFVSELSDAYPGVIVGEELGRARLWCEANPTKRKQNVRRFLTNWVARQQDAAPRPAKQSSDAWWTSHAGIDRKGRELGMQARGNEGYDDFKARIFDRLREQA